MRAPDRTPDSDQEKVLTQVETNIQRHLPHHPQYFQKIIERAKAQFEAGYFFTSEVEKNIEANVPEERLLAEFIDDLFTALSKIKSTEVPGHEIAHIHDNLASALRIFHEYNDLLPYEKFEIIAAIIGHDLGRYNEAALPDIDPNDVEFLVPLLLGRKFVRTHDVQIPKELQMRVIYDIATGGKAITGHKTADTVHQADREQLLGSATIPRGIAFDVLENGLSLSIKQDQLLREKLPTPGSTEDTSQLIQYEFYMRNLYPFHSPKGQEVSDELKKQQVVVLMLGTYGNEELYRQIFQPELVGGAAEVKHWSKKPINQEIFKQAKEETLAFQQQLIQKEYSQEKLCEMIFTSLEYENIIIPENAREKIRACLATLSESEKLGWWAIINYTRKKRAEKCKENIAILENTQGAIELVLREHLLPDYSQRLEKLSLRASY